MTADLQLWDQRIKDAEKERKEWFEQFQVEKSLAYFEGKQNEAGLSPEEWITINKVYTHLMSQLPILYSVNPYFYVKGKRTRSVSPDEIGTFEEKGRSRQNNLNYLKDALDLKTTARVCIQDAHFSMGIIKTSYTAKTVKNPDAGKEIKTESGETATDEEGNPLVEPDEIPTDEKYLLVRVRAENFLFGKESSTLPNTWTWLGEKFTLTESKAREDRRLRKSVIDEAANKAKVAQKGRDSKEELILTFYEIYDITANRWFIHAEGAKDYAMKPRGLPLGIVDHPYSILRFVLRDNTPYPIPPISQGLGPQKEYNLSRSRILAHRKRFNRKYEVFVQGLVDDSELDKLEAGDDGTIIQKQTPERVVSAIQDAPLDQQTYSEIALLNADLVELLGAPDQARGIASADSATEAGIIDARMEMRESDRKTLVTDWIIDVAKKLDRLVQAHITEDEAVAIEGPEGARWELVRADDYKEVAGEYEYSVNLGSTMPRLPQVERAQWIAFMTQVVIPMPAILTKPNIMRRMAEMFGIEDENMLNEFREMAQQMFSGQLPVPGNQGSQPGVPEQNPAASVGGAALGFLGGIANGGGNPEG